MFCPKCGTENPETGKFCRKCGRDLSDISTEGRNSPFSLEDWTQEKLAPHFAGAHRKGKKIKQVTWESAMGSLFLGLSLVVVSGILAFQEMSQNWWFWLMIPAFLLMGHGIAKIIKIEKNLVDYVEDPDTDKTKQISVKEEASLPPKRTEYAAETFSPKYETGEVVPASIVENTTRNLEVDPEAKTNVLTENQE